MAIIYNLGALSAAFSLERSQKKSAAAARS